MSHNHHARSYVTNRAAMLAIGDELDRAELKLTDEQERAAMLLALAKKELKPYWPFSACIRQARLEVADLGIAS